MKPSRRKTENNKPSKSAAFKGRTFLGFVLDRSGSMINQRDAAINGFNEYLQEQQRLTDDTTLTLVLFSSHVDVLHVNTPLADVPPLTSTDYLPYGNTALFDAVGETVELIGKMMGPDDRAIITTFTDGEENSSRELRTPEEVKKLITDHEATGRWTFAYMGSGKNWTEQAARMGYRVQNTAHFDQTNVRGSVRMSSQATYGLRSTNNAQSVAFYSGGPVTPFEDSDLHKALKASIKSHPEAKSKAGD
jgi:uncharacterized protein YegL